jgi:hypothetical protein
LGGFQCMVGWGWGGVVCLCLCLCLCRCPLPPTSRTCNTSPHEAGMQVSWSSWGIACRYDMPFPSSTRRLASQPQSVDIFQVRLAGGIEHRHIHKHKHTDTHNRLVSCECCAARVRLVWPRRREVRLSFIKILRFLRSEDVLRTCHIARSLRSCSSHWVADHTSVNYTASLRHAVRTSILLSGPLTL